MVERRDRDEQWAGRTRWSDDRLDDREEELRALKALPQRLAEQAVRVEAIERRMDQADDDRGKIHTRLDAFMEALSERDREYHRNVLLILAPIAVAALGILAKVVFHVG